MLKISYWNYLIYLLWIWALKSQNAFYQQFILYLKAEDWAQLINIDASINPLKAI